MGHAYQAVGWDRQKKLYDFTLLGLVLLVASVFGTITALRHPGTTAETFIIRFTSVAAFLLLHVTLAIGPLGSMSEGVELKEPGRPAPNENVGAGTAPLLAPAFFIVWQSNMAPALGRFVRGAVIPLAALVPAIVGAVVWFPNPVERGRFEFGVEKQFEGVREQPRRMREAHPPLHGASGGREEGIRSLP